MSDWLTEYFRPTPKRDSVPSTPARTDLSRVVPVPASHPEAPAPRSEPRPSFSSDVENLSIGLGRGLTSQLEGLKTLVTQPRQVYEGLKQFAGQVADDPRVLAQMAEDYGVRATSGPLGFGEVAGEFVSPLPKTKIPTAGIRKAPGGNWLPGSVEKFVDKLRGEFVVAGDRPAERLRKLNEFVERNPDYADRPGIANERIRVTANLPVDKWLETKLTNYIKNDMATERDPVRRGIEQRVAKADETYARGKERIAKNQKKIADAKARGENTATAEDRLALEIADIEQKYWLDRRAAEAVSTPDRYLTQAIAQQRGRDGDPTLAASPEAANWEDVTDYMVEKDRALLYQDEKEWPVGLSGPMPDWIKKVSPNTPIYSLYRADPGPFAHMRDELVNSLRENSGLPPELRLKPEDLDKMGMDAVAAHVGKIDAWRLRDRMAADLLKSRNAATVTFKEYPGTGLEWKELKMPKGQLSDTDKKILQYGDSWGADIPAEALSSAEAAEGTRLLQEALEYEGSVMGHCVGGYCPQVAAGKTQIFSLRDAKGEPHVTIEVKPGSPARAIGSMPNEERVALAQEVKDRHFGGVMPGRSDEDKFFQLLDQAYLEKYGPPPADIVQIKGKGNKKPADKYIPFVQDFVKSGKWSEIGDFHNTDLFRFDPKPELKQALIEAGVESPEFVTKEQLDALVEWGSKGRLQGDPVPKFCEGGRVNMADGGRADSERQAIVNQIRKTDWFKEFVKQYGEEPDLSENADYDYITAWKSGVRPERDPYDQNRFHWSSRTSEGTMLKKPGHPTLWKTIFMDQTGINPDAIGLKSEQQAQEWLKRNPIRKADGGQVDEEEYDEGSIEEIVAPLRQRFEQFTAEARKVPRRVKQAAASATEIGEIIKRSNEIPLKYFEISGEAGGEADAMRHLLFQAQLAQKYGETPAKAISFLHEYTSPGQPEAERLMDFYNDELGRQIAREAKSDKDLVALAEKYVKTGRAKVLPKEQRGGYK